MAPAPARRRGLSRSGAQPEVGGAVQAAAGPVPSRPAQRLPSSYGPAWAVSVGRGVARRCPGVADSVRAARGLLYPLLCELSGDQV